METEKIIALYKFVKEFCKTRRTIICNDNNYFWKHYINNIPDDQENINVFYIDKDEEFEFDDIEQDYLLKVHKPEFQKCPVPDQKLKKWLVDGWELPKNEVKLKGNLDDQKLDQDEVILKILNNDENIFLMYKEWLEKRLVWQSDQAQIERTRAFFDELYMIYVELQKDSEVKELIIANGYIKDNNDESIFHPILTKRLDITFDAAENTIYIINTDAKTELYSELLQIMKDINIESLSSIVSDLIQNDFHPMDKKGTKDFLKTLVHKLSSDSKFIDEENEDEFCDNRIQMIFNPCIIMRNKLDNTVKTLEQIVKNIEDTGFVPKHLLDIVNGGILDKPEEVQESIEESLAKTGGESIDILLCKEANREQLEIAKRIENYNAVLVQGPPGTGKTHTIANLVGHFLAQGKSILVTSHTKKALTVLKEKLPKSLQSLCVSILNDSNDDMENSIDGITDYISRTTSVELKKQMVETNEDRLKIINDLSSVRKKIYNILYDEYKSIVLNGEAISPSDAAKFIQKNREKLAYINGSVTLYSPLPITKDELDYLYSTNSKISSDEEKELSFALPNPTELIYPEHLNNKLDEIKNLNIKINIIKNKKAWKINLNEDDIFFETNFSVFYISNLDEKNIEKLREYINNLNDCEEWSRIVCCDGMRGGAYSKRWKVLIENIKQTSSLSEKILENHYDKKVTIDDNNILFTYKPIIKKMKKIFARKGKISKIDLLVNKEFNKLLSEKIINGRIINDYKDCEYLLDYLKLIESRNDLAILWNNLMGENGVTSFYNLDEFEPEKIAEKWIDRIDYYLTWYNKDFKELKELLENAKFPSQIILRINDLDKDIIHIKKIFDSIKNTIPFLIDICNYKISIDKAKTDINRTIEILENNSLINSSICINMKSALLNNDREKYLTNFKLLESIYKKYELLNKRNELLSKIEKVAPGWARDIKNRNGIHGRDDAPQDIVEAWKYKQYELILEELTKESLEELQRKSQKLSLQYRKSTEKYAEKSAWYNLLSRTECDIDLRHNLKGWELTVKKIGKAQGKNAPKYKAQARELMAKCQQAVPCWIMPIDKALETLKPGENEFDIVIIDEASQSDISALAISYFAKKMIVVGDDKQVSPMAVGIEENKINALQQLYIRNKIPNFHLYTLKTSLYDIAATTFQPLMLKEHFRCVPEIIGFSNMLSYDFKIKPLRDSESSNLLPAVINHRVQGKRVGKVNKLEAETIVSYIMGCLTLDEYKDKTFGVISLLGDEQVKLIQSLIFKHIAPIDIENRKILIGNASNFQGDERDVIFLSMVDSDNEDGGPLSFSGNGIEDATKKRYNVATSRARDQLWVINSLDASVDLKPGDIRKKLLDYASNPNAFFVKEQEIEKNSESIFEEEVSKKLMSEGYHIVQQYPVGAYRLDIVVICENRKVAIECDGEKYHSGSEKIKEDMQRQAILERIGWKFIRIRGSQYFKDPSGTMNSVIEELNFLKIYPENTTNLIKEVNSKLLEKVKIISEQFLQEIKSNCAVQTDYNDILYALNFKSDKNTSNKIKVHKQNLNSNINFEKSQFKYMVLYSSGVGIKDIALYYKVNSSVVKKELLSIAEKYNVRDIDDCVTLFKKAHSNTNIYINIINTYNVKQNNDFKMLSNTGYSNEEQKDNVFIEELLKNSIDFIDNRKTSGIIWVINCEKNQELIEQILKKSKYSYTFEKRGAVVTNNKPAWRVMYKTGGKNGTRV